LMLTKNSDVGNGQVNGSRVVCQCMKLKVGEDTFPLKLNVVPLFWVFMLHKWIQLL
jgi:hypothetical protein